jgi:hypothetical protein
VLPCHSPAAFKPHILLPTSSPRTLFACCVIVALQPCPAHTVTPDQFNPGNATVADLQAAEAVTSADQCSTLPGYGWVDGVATPCSIGYWAHGFDNQVGGMLAIGCKSLAFHWPQGCRAYSL